jgi:membrane-bound lytic murein transglycosylase A
MAGCDAREPSPDSKAAISLHPVAYANLTGWAEDRTAAALPPLQAACSALRAVPAGKRLGANGAAVTSDDWEAVCEAIVSLTGSDAVVRHFLETWFVPFAVVAGDDADGLFTGYYEPELEGSRLPGTAHPVPLYRRPPDLVSVNLADFRADLADSTLVGQVVDGRLEPYPNRAEIDAGALSGRGLELLWLADPIDAFFLHVQGSGRVRLSEGSSVSVGFAASNGHPYTAIGRILVERGALTKEAATMQTVRQWLRDHPDQATALMQMNARYVFFRELEGDGPVGSLGAVLTPGRSMAVDATLLPLGAPLWLDTTYPPGTPKAGQPLRRLMVAQDTGSAIKGAVRGDLYWGSGEAALRYAGPMKQRGRYYLLLPKTVAARIGGGP